jgi:hypothetical protein
MYFSLKVRQGFAKGAISLFIPPFRQKGFNLINFALNSFSMKRLLLTIATLLLLVAYSFSQTQKSETTLTKVWETGPDFRVPESVLFDPFSQVLYVSSINGKPLEKDGNGFISKISLDGKMITSRWATGLNAPKGMGISGNRLFVTDIDQVVEIDLQSGRVVKTYLLPNAGFLNDIAVSSDGDVYISDMSSTRIYKISKGNLSTFLDNEMITSPNGLYINGKFMLIGCGKLVLAPLMGGSPEEWLTGTGSIDGLKGTGDKRFLFSDWQGNIYIVGTDKSIVKLLDLTTEKKNAADIEFIPSMKLLLIPTFGANTVAAYKLNN